MQYMAFPLLWKDYVQRLRYYCTLFDIGRFLCHVITDCYFSVSLFRIVKYLLSLSRVIM